MAEDVGSSKPTKETTIVFYLHVPGSDLFMSKLFRVAKAGTRWEAQRKIPVLNRTGKSA